MNPMSTFRPAPGVLVHDDLNDTWFELSPEMVASMESDAAEYGVPRAYPEWVA